MQWKEMTARTEGDVAVVDVAGDSALWEEDELLGFVLELVRQGVRKFVLDLHRFPHVDSLGLGGIVRVYTTVAHRGGKLKLLHVSSRIQQLFAVVRLESVFEVFDSVDEAVRSFGQGSERPLPPPG